MAITTFPYYGLHEYEGVQWVVQAQGVMQNALGLPPEKAKVLNKKYPCPHKIDFSLMEVKPETWITFHYFARHSDMLKSFLPDDFTGSTYILGEGYALQRGLAKLTHLMSPIEKQYYQMFEVPSGSRIALFVEKFQSSNLVKPVISGIKKSDTVTVHNFMRAVNFVPAHIIFSGAEIPLKIFEPDVRIIEPDKELLDFIEPLTAKEVQSLGAYYIMDKMRKFTNASV